MLSPPGDTGEAYSTGYSARCRVIKPRSSSSAASIGMVRIQAIALAPVSGFRLRRRFAERIHLRVRVINLPVEPVIFQREDLLQLFTGKRAADRLAAETPSGRRFVDKLN